MSARHYALWIVVLTLAIIFISALIAGTNTVHRLEPAPTSTFTDMQLPNGDAFNG